MASNAAVIGALSVIIGGDSAALDKVLKGAQSNIDSFVKRVTGIAGGIGLEKVVESAVGSVTDTINKGLEAADALAKMSQTTGSSVEELSKLKYGADLAGISSETLGKSLQSLAGGLTSLASGAVTPASQALTAMGLSAKNTDGSIKTSTQTLAEIADKFQSYKDGAAKATLAAHLFGAGGEALIPLLNKGSTGLAQLGDEAKKFGLVIDGDTATAVQSLNENLKKLDAIKQGLAVTVTARLIPSLEQLSEAYLGVKESSTFTAQAADVVTKAIQVLVGEFAIATLQVRNAGKELQEFWKFIQAVGDIDDLRVAWKNWDEVVKQNEASLVGLKSTLDDVFTGAAGFASRFGALIDNDMRAAAANVDAFNASMKSLAGVLSHDAPTSAAATINALQTFLDRTQKNTAAVEAQAQTVGKGADEQARLKVQLEASAIATAKGIEVNEEYRQKIEAVANAAAGAAQKLAGAQITQQSLAPWEQRNILLAQYKSYLDAGTMSTEAFAAASAKLQFPAFTTAKNQALDYSAQLDQLAATSLNGVATAFAQVATGQKSMGDAFSAFALQFLTSLVEMIVKALIFKAIMTAIGFAGGGPVSPATALATGIQPMAGGGLIMGPGTGTSDSIPALLSNGEYVVNAAQTKKYAAVLDAINMDRLPRFADGGAVSGAVSLPASSFLPIPGAGGAPQPVTLQMKGAFFDRKTLADLIDGLNGMFSNGYKLKLA